MKRKETKQTIGRAIRFATLMLAVGIVACTPDDEPVIDLKVTLTEVATTDNSITVGINPQNAEKCYIDIVERGTGVPSAEEVIASGDEVANTASNYTISNLTADTEYIVVAAVKAGSQVEKAILETSTQASGANIEGATQLNIVREAFYRTGDPSGNGNYQIVISNTTEMGWEGDTELVMDLYNVLDSDPLNAVLPSGVYEPAADKAPFTYVPDYTYISIVRDGEIFASPVMGTITVSRNGGEYTIVVEGELIVDQSTIKASYTGPIQFVESVTALWTKFEEPQNITLERAQGRYWGGWFYPFADDLGLEFFAGTTNDAGEITDGYFLQLANLYIPKVIDYNAATIEIPNGTYNVVSDNPFYTSSYAQPFTFDYGYQMDFYGTLLNVGTYVTYTYQEENINQIGYIVDGTVTVSGSGSNYTFDFEFLTEEGVAINATYEGAIDLVNYNDNDLDQLWGARPWTTLTADHTYEWKPETEAYAFLEGDYIKEGLDTWLVMIMASNDNYPDGYGDFFTTELLVPVGGGAEFPTGTFEISWELDEYVMIPGFMTYAGGICFTHYGDLTPDAEGYSTAQAALAGGTVTISKTDSGEYKFVFDTVDGLGHKVTGEWQGAVVADDLRGSVSDDEDHDHDHDHAHAPKQVLRVRR